MPKTQGVSLSRKRITLGIALITAGLILLVVVPHPLSYQAPFNVLLPSLTFILVCTVTIVFGTLLLTGSRIKMFVIPLVLGITCAYGVLLPLMLLPLTEEVLVIAMGFSSLLPVGLYLLYAKLKQKRVKDSKKRSQ